MIIINVYFCKKVMKIYVEVEYKVRQATATAEKYLSFLTSHTDGCDGMALANSPASNPFLLLFIYICKIFASKEEECHVIAYLMAEGVGFCEKHQ